MSNPHQRQKNKKYAWKTPPKLPHSRSRGKKTDIPTLQAVERVCVRARF